MLLFLGHSMYDDVWARIYAGLLFNISLLATNNACLET
jgi:hypothetical protein